MEDECGVFILGGLERLLGYGEMESARLDCEVKGLVFDLI